MAEVAGASLTEIVRDAQRQKPEKSGRNPYRELGSTEFGDAFTRMFSSRIGSEAVAIVGNEEKTLNILEAFGTDVLLAVLELQGFFRGRKVRMHAMESEDDLRAVVVPPSYDAPAALVILDPRRSVEDTESITSNVPLDLKALEHVVSATPRYFEPGRDISNVQQFLFATGVIGLKEALWITQPDIVISRRPKMVPLCAPWPCLDVTSPTQMSTAGIFCRNAAGELGVTACFHGTGPVGTQVQVGLQQATVTISDNIQDTVFVPLSNGYNLPQLRGHSGVLRDRAPGLQDQVEFYGVSSRATKTQIESYDAGILRFRRTVQLRVQTGADTNTGDSGSALINQDDKVIGFAFERAAFGEKPQITDWIWAANALSALGLTPV